MAMTKKEQAAMQALIDRAETLAALRWTAPVEKDVPPPEPGRGGFTEGWTFFEHSMRVERGWSESTAHGSGPYPRDRSYRSASQNARSMFSTEAKALAALRHALELKAARELMAVDRRIRALEDGKGGEA